MESAKIKKEFPKNWITLYTDATFPSNKIASYAFYAKSDYFTLKKSKLCPTEIDNINDAELYAIAQGIYSSLNKWKDTVGFYIRTDSMSAIYRLQHLDRTTTSKGNDLSDVTIRLQKSLKKLTGNLTLDIKHIKAHTGRKTIQAYLNNHCDKQSRIPIKHFNKTLTK